MACPETLLREVKLFALLDDEHRAALAQLADRSSVEADTVLFHAGDVPLAGVQNLENAMAAALLARAIGAEPEEIRNGLRSFQGLPHRMQRVGERNGVVFYDDSKGTNPGAVLKSLEGFADNTVHLILGGRNKGADLASLTPLVRQKARRVYLIGEAAGEFEQALKVLSLLPGAGTSYPQAGVIGLRRIHVQRSRVISTTRSITTRSSSVHSGARAGNADLDWISSQSYSSFGLVRPTLALTRDDCGASATASGTIAGRVPPKTASELAKTNRGGLSTRRHASSSARVASTLTRMPRSNSASA